MNRQKNSYQKRQKSISDHINPLMNKKLQGFRSSEEKIACVYKNSSNKILKNKKRVDSIPLLKNLKVNSVNKIGIIKETDKKCFNIIFRKKGPDPKSSIQENNKMIERKIQTHGCKRATRYDSPSRN